MKSITALFALLCVAVSILSFGHFTYVSPQGEKAFAYDLASGKAVNPVDNPLLPSGFNATWGWNKRFFSVIGTIMDDDFSPPGHGSSPFDDSLEWNCSEGVIMKASYRLYGRVSDPWEFFLHFGESEHSYKVAHGKDVHVYEAMRQAGQFIDKQINEYAAVTDAESIRVNPEPLKQRMLKEAGDYMKQFGFEVNNLMFIGNFTNPNGNVITEARQQLTTLDSDIRAKSQERTNKASQASINVSQAKIEANTKIAEANRRASVIKAESQALANALKQSIEQVGIEGTLKIRMAELQGDLMRDGVMPIVILNEDALLSSAFYPVARSAGASRPAVLTNQAVTLEVIRGN